PLPVDATRVDSLIRDVLEGEFDEGREVKSLKERNLDPPQRTVTLTVKDKAPLTLGIGQVEDGTNSYAYVVSSERPDIPGAVQKQAMRGAIEDKPVNYFRARELFHGDSSDVTRLKISEAKKAVDLEKVDGRWQFVEPKYGLASLDSNWLQNLEQL